jgi:hypothetical protein
LFFQSIGISEEDTGFGKANRHFFKAELHGTHLNVLQLPQKLCRPTSVLLQEMNLIRVIHHINLTRFVGLCLDEDDFCLYLLEESCEKGFLVELMANDSVALDDVFKNSFIRDIVEVP